ncbi:MAG TPA: DUF3551 domain-containing protein [Rhizomicrobium sp.]|jgi:hypothetical protein|nr:DUF3551 domain-containing protein [Rhizomicrobium sp.]
MRILALTMLAIGTVSMAAPAAGQPYDNYPICLRVFGDPTYTECRYVTLGQCKESASGRGAECFINPYFASAEGPAGPRHHRRRHHV